MLKSPVQSGFLEVLALDVKLYIFLLETILEKQSITDINFHIFNNFLVFLRHVFPCINDSKYDDAGSNYITKLYKIYFETKIWRWRLFLQTQSSSETFFGIRTNTHLKLEILLKQQKVNKFCSLPKRFRSLPLDGALVHLSFQVPSL